MPSAPTPFVVIEEHHQAFQLWGYARHAGWIAGCNNRLIHVDQHADLDLPRPDQALCDLADTPEASQRFTEQELGPSSFILPAVYLGWIKEMIWVRADCYDFMTHNNLAVASLGKQARDLISGRPEDLRPLFPGINKDRKSINHYLVGPDADLPPSQQETSLLGICLDYFSCNVFPVFQNNYIEITSREYEAFLRDPFHVLKLGPGARIRAEQRGDRHILLFNKIDKPPYPRLRSDENEIQSRIQALSAFLTRNKIYPALIHISRSRLSGYTPADQWQMIENQLIDALRQIYSLCHEEIPHLAQAPPVGTASSQHTSCLSCETPIWQRQEAS